MVGVAGGAEKCTYMKDELSFDAIINYKSDDLDGALATACPDGINIYFESVSGALTESVAKKLNDGARMPIYGYISNYKSKDST